MANYKLSGAAGLPAFPLATIFVDKYMPVANATFVKVYLYGLRMCYAVGVEMNNADIAKALDILETDVKKAWKYWEGAGVVTLNENDVVEFVDLTLEPPEPQEESKKPRYTPKELAEVISDNGDVRLLLEHAQNIFGKTFSVNDTSILYSMFDWLKLPVEVILMLFEHCAALDKCNMRYAEKVAVSWAEEGIDTIEKAEQSLKKSQEKSVLSKKFQKIFKKTGRDFSDAEFAYIDQWTKEMKMPQELVKAAYEKAVLATGNATFPYINAILQSWFRQGFKTVADLKRDIKKPEKKNIPPGKNKFVGYEQSGEYDFDEIEKIAMQKRMKAVGAKE
jgi:DnaD/phage-associated family protein